MTAWFGPTWHAPVNADGPEIGVPVGKQCASCGEPVKEGDQGLALGYVGTNMERDVIVFVEDVPHVPYHLSCFMRLVVGYDAAPKVTPVVREGAAGLARRRSAEK